MYNIFNIRPKGYNIGNEMIHFGLQNFLYEAFGEVVNIITIPATDKYDNGRAGLTKKTIYEINNYGHGVIVGGGNLYENNEIDIDLNALKALQVPLMVFSVSRGRIYNNRLELVDRTDVIPDNKLRALTSRANYNLLRDQATVKYIKNLGEKGIKFGGCPTQFIADQVKNFPEVATYGENLTLISLRHPDLMNIPLNLKYNVVNDVRNIIKFLKNKGHKNIKLLCHDHRDIPFAASFIDVEYIYTSDINTYVSLLKNSDLVVTYRLHSFLPCIAMGTPSINISYDERAMNLVSSVGYEDWNINMVTENLMDSLEDRYSKLDNLKKLKTKNIDKWNEIYNTITNGFDDFARDVKKYKEGL